MDSDMLLLTGWGVAFFSVIAAVLIRRDLIYLQHEVGLLVRHPLRRPLMCRLKLKRCRILLSSIHGHIHAKSSRMSVQWPLVDTSIGRQQALDMFLTYLLDQSGGDCISLVYRSSEEQLVTRHVHRRGVCGTRFEEALYTEHSRFSGGIISDAVRWCDYLLEQRVVGNMLPFGFRLGLVCRPEYCGEMIWIGFNSSVGDRDQRKAMCLNFIEYMDTQMRAYDDFNTLDGEYTQEKKRSEERAQMLAYAAHDMRSPINNLKLLLELAITARGEDTCELFKRMKANCDMLSDIVDDARDFSRFRAGVLSAEKTACSCVSLIERVCLTLAQAAQKKGLPLEWHIESSLYWNVDLRQVERVLANVIGNAVAYTNAGFVRVSAWREPDNRISVRVQDSGTGMTSDQVQRIFEPYSRFADRVVEGSGLGMTLTRIFTEINGGTISISSEPGVGTMVTLTFEGLDDTITVDTMEPTAVCSRILLIDDSQDSIDSLSRVLRTHGFEVASACTGSEALEVAGTFTPEVVISDLSLAGERGEVIVEQLYRLYQLRGVVLLSGRGVYTEHLDMLGWEGLVYQSKPLDIPWLLAYLKAVNMRKNLYSAGRGLTAASESLYQSHPLRALAAQDETVCHRVPE